MPGTSRGTVVTKVSSSLSLADAAFPGRRGPHQKVPKEEARKVEWKPRGRPSQTARWDLGGLCSEAGAAHRPHLCHLDHGLAQLLYLILTV